MKRLLLGLFVFPPAMMACASSEDSSESGVEALSAACAPVVACKAPALAPVARREWRHPIKSPLIATDSPRHRGRDLFLNPGAPQTVIGKFSYGKLDVDLVDEEVDVFVERGCSGSWEKLGTALTTSGPGGHATTEGVEDTSGGRVYFDIPTAKRLDLGRHRVRLVVAGDGSSTDLFLEVVAPKTPVFVSDVDGTLTSSELIEFVKLLEGELPETHPGAPEALRALAAKGYHPVYMTARPEWLLQRTRDFLDARGFPPGLVRTSTSVLGVGLGPFALPYKREELAMLASKGLVPAFAFGNKSSDEEAYAGAGIKPEDRILFKFSGAGRRIDSYNDLLAGFLSLPSPCPR